jgi:chromosome segregation ATPase
MTVQKKLPSDIEENIQNLAGDIYLQIEDKITALLTSYTDNIDVSPEVITTHPLYVTLEEQLQSQQLLATKSEQENNSELEILKAEQKAQHSQLAQLQEELTNAENLNSAKLTDSEQILKDKLAENSQLVKQVATLNQENEQQKQQLKTVSLAAENATTTLNELTSEKDALAKNDKAKAATLSVQNQQYSDLQLKFDQVSSELEYLKAEQEHKLLSTSEQLNHEQQQVNLLHEQISALQKELKNKQVSVDQQQATITKVEHENSDLTVKVSSLEQTIEQIEQDAVSAQQQYEKEKQQINDKWLNEQEKNALVLKQLSADNEQVIKQIHEAERNIQALENKLSEANGELVAANKQHLQVVDTVNSLELELQKSQALSAKLSTDNLHLNTSLEQSEHKHNSNNEQQAKQIAELTQALDKSVNEAKNSQQTIADLSQENHTQLEKINELLSRNENEQLKFKQAIDKQDENHKQVVTGHLQVLADKNKALTELQRQADTTASDLTQQLEAQVTKTETAIAKFSELELSYTQALENVEKIEQDLNKKQTQLTTVKAELDQDRARTAKNRLLHQENKGKQEVEYNKARETIKYLRDENTELNRKLDQQINELEDKLTEYRLRFEYAQKQITKLSK